MSKLRKSLGENALTLPIFSVLFILPSLSLAAPSLEQRQQAAAYVANQDASCHAIQPFYWEIGDRHGMQASATIGGGSPTAQTIMPIASASKWIFGSYVVEYRHGNLSATDLKALTMRSGYNHLNYGHCIRLLPIRQQSETVAECATTWSNDEFTPAQDGRFFYNGGHFQMLASNGLRLGDMDSAHLTAAIGQEIGTDMHFSYSSPQLAAGIETSAADYALFLRKILNQQLLIATLLGSHAVCTNPATCPTADYTPVPSMESWHYSIAHWVEDDPQLGDGAFSSPGAFGFYPWIDASKKYYGIIARHSMQPKAYYESVQCGRKIRSAWLNGQR